MPNKKTHLKWQLKKSEKMEEPHRMFQNPTKPHFRTYIIQAERQWPTKGRQLICNHDIDYVLLYYRADHRSIASHAIKNQRLGDTPGFKYRPSTFTLGFLLTMYQSEVNAPNWHNM